jgi:cytochrome c biogenesis protein CcdA
VRSYFSDLRRYAAALWWLPLVGAILALVAAAAATALGRDDVSRLAGSIAWGLGLGGCVLALAVGVGRPAPNRKSVSRKVVR